MSTLDPELHELLNKQINEEMAASYSYLAMSAWFEDSPYGGFAQWMLAQSQEETTHAMKFYHFLVDRGSRGESQSHRCAPSRFLESPRSL